MAYARQTLIQFFESTHISNSKQESPDLSRDLKLHDIISWGVWNKFGDQPITGWMSELNQVLHI